MQVLVKSALLLALTAAQPLDLITGLAVDHNMLSVGFSYIDDLNWFTITTNSNEFERDTVFLGSIPILDTSLGTFPLAIKMREQNTLNADGTVSFTIKLVQPNDSFCAKTFGYTPAYIVPQTQIAWIIFEVGAYTINSFPYYVGKGPVSRYNGAATATFTNGNLVVVSFPVGCGTTTDVCAITATGRGILGQVQTNINVKEVGKDMYLTLRTRSVDQRRAQWVLIPHDAATLSYGTLVSETIGYMAFQTGISIACFEKMVWETQIFANSVNFVPVTYNYQNSYNYPPGLFGLVGTITSLCNIILRSSSWTTTSAQFAITEDQCVKTESRHTTSETVFVVAVGENKSSRSNLICKVQFNSALNPTLAPTAYPSTVPTYSPSRVPTRAPSASPSRAPTFVPSSAPTRSPTGAPSATPSSHPSSNPTFNPSSAPTFKPTAFPSSNPSSNPTFNPSSAPTFKPSPAPTVNPTIGTTAAPTNLCGTDFPVTMTKE